MKKYFNTSFISQVIFFFFFVSSVISIGILFSNQLFPKFEGEAYTGEPFYKVLNTNWTFVKEDGTRYKIDLPAVEDADSGERLVIENIVPDYVQDNMVLLTRSSRQNIHIYIDENLRSEYVSDNLKFWVRNVPSAYVFVPISRSDAGRRIRIESWGSSSFRGNIQQVIVAQSSSAWNHLWTRYGVIVISNLILLLCGIVALIISLIIMVVTRIRPKIIYLAYSLILFSLWAICESRLRQIIFKNSSIAGIVVFVFMVLMVIPLYTYWNYIQKQRYAIWYNCVNGTILIFTLFTTVSYLLHKHDFFDFILVNYAFIAIGILLIFITTFIDLKHGLLREYMFSVVGMMVVLVAGCLELVLSRIMPFYAAGFLMSISLIIMLVFSGVQGVRDIIAVYQSREKHSAEQTLKIIKTVAGTIDAKDEYTGGHSARVADYAVALARALGKDEAFCKNLHYIGLMHDIGKIGVPDSILNKKGSLVQDEFSLMRLHTKIGCEIIGGIESVMGLKEGVLYHHERYDGSGYPDGLVGEKIPEVARILCIADSYDAMTSNRVYRRRLSDEEVRKEYEKWSGKQFDPHMVEVFLKLLDSKSIRPVSADGFATFDGEHSSLSLALQKLIHAQNIYSGAYEMTNPEFMRMIVYVLKLAERNDQSVIVKLFSVESQNGDRLQGEDLFQADTILRSSINSRIRNSDITTPYSMTKRLVLFINLPHEKANDVIHDIEEKFRKLDTKGLYKLYVEDIVLK
ncbi:MAG: HD domain-containing protein [Treponema sp.]|nr:HD domain-containing protein [Treponema sp.]